MSIVVVLADSWYCLLRCFSANSTWGVEVLDYYHYENTIPEDLSSESIVSAFDTLVVWFESDIQGEIEFIDADDEPHIESWYIADMNFRFTEKTCNEPIRRIIGMPNTWNRVFDTKEYSISALRAQEAIDLFESNTSKDVDAFLSVLAAIADTYSYFNGDAFNSIKLIADTVANPNFEKQADFLREWVMNLDDNGEDDRYRQSETFHAFDNDITSDEFFEFLTANYQGISGIESDSRFIHLFEVDSGHKHGSSEVSGRLLSNIEYLSNDVSPNKFRRLSEGGCSAKLRNGYWVCAGEASANLLSSN